MIELPTYVLITPARNEEKFIELTIESIVAQTVVPLKWVIVSDGSTDRTDEIVMRYAATHSWIELVRMPERKERHFAGKVHAFNAGYSKIQGIPYDAIGNVDADTSFPEDYFSFLLSKLAEFPHLGVIGTAFRDASHSTYNYRFVNIEHVSGPCQFFRRACFEQIGGYLPIKGGGVDHVSVVTARMKGWTTRTFTDIIYQQHRNMGEGASGKLVGRFKYGGKDYLVGNHPLWELFRIAYQMTQKPVVIGGLMIGAGYISSMVRGYPRPVSSDFIAFQHREQLRRLRNFFAEQYDVYKLHSSSISH
jgi:glycosyltransferase involved in cell wall biosynthesis